MSGQIPAVWMRGGTSKAAFFLAADLPALPAERDALLLRLFGSPDPTGRQLDGIGGGTSSTSKAAIIGPSTRPDADVDYLFAQVGIEDAIVDLRGNCGNISSAVGPFAVDAGLVPAGPPVRIHNVNTGTIIVAHVPTRDGRFDPVGDLTIPGVPFPGSSIRLDFVEPGGAVTGKLLPSGNVTDDLTVPGLGTVRASIVDAANPVVFVRADDVDGDDLALVAAVRAAGAVRAGMIARPEDAPATPAVPRVALVAPPGDYRTRAGTWVAAADNDVLVAMHSMGRLHPALPLTGAIATAVAARLPGSVVHDVAHDRGTAIRLGHPGGVQEIEAVVTGMHAERVSTYRTARRLMSGLLETP